MRWVVYCHPDNVDLLRRFFAASAAKLGLPQPGIPGEELIGNAFVPRTGRRWEFPATPFVEYEKRDEAWAIPLGFGRWVDDGLPVFYRMRVA